jgi:ubiquinone/menaquinone biosynthesis C-methylase UbiE
MDLLCDRVGATGETVGVDTEARMVAMARDVAAELNLTNLTVVEAAATDTGLEPASVSGRGCPLPSFLDSW